MYIGNDIVAYKHTRCLGKWQQDIFLEKVLQPDEITQLLLQDNKDAFLWSLWTLKEAAYKLSCFLGNRKKFHALQFSIQQMPFITNAMVQHISLPSTNLSGPAIHQLQTTVQFNDQVFFGHTSISFEFVHSLVTDTESMHDQVWAIGLHNHYQKNDYSAAVRSFAKQKLNEQGLFFNAIEKDTDGIPYLVFDKTARYISLSHDQQFVSFSYSR
jgi:phosphopantetheinyl transferase (holo-ACP synthase)